MVFETRAISLYVLLDSSLSKSHKEELLLNEDLTFETKAKVYALQRVWAVMTQVVTLTSKPVHFLHPHAHV